MNYDHSAHGKMLNICYGLNAGGLQEMIHENGTLMSWSSALIKKIFLIKLNYFKKRAQRSLSALHHVKTQWKWMEPRREPSPEPDHAGLLCLNFSP